MFTDTHCHLDMMKEKGIDIAEFFREYTCSDFNEIPFMLDAGTKADDYYEHRKNREIAKEITGTESFLHFSAGIWPAKEDIQNRFEECEKLKKILEEFAVAKKEICAIGECGFDRRENPKEAGEAHLLAEEELFAMQVELAKRFNLPLIVHSRDAFEETYGVLKNGAHNRVVIHCFSYDRKAARMFLDLGCRISFSGTITFGKNAQKETNCELLRYVPKDLLLLETDAPYLAPVPFRGKVNTPLLIEHTYRFVAETLNMPLDSLALLIKKNASEFFL